ncbi:g9427 [Coccomyxa elongata]
MISRKSAAQTYTVPRQRLVIALDNSKDCLVALNFALEHFPEGYSYHLVHIQPRPLASSILASTVAAPCAQEGKRARDMEKTADTNRFMEEIFAPKARSAGAEAFALVLDSDSDSSSHIGAAICKYAEEIKPDALVMMRQNKPAISRFFMGSVTKYCADHSTVPTIIVPNRAA